MSLSTSKSKTQLAYASTQLSLSNLGSTKPVNKTKSKNTSIVQVGDTTKNRNAPRNSTGNIYDSIMGQIQPKQQDYIKSLIVKNQKEAIKQEKLHHAEKQIDTCLGTNKNDSKKNLNTSTIINALTPTTVLKVQKQAEVPVKKSNLGLHQRTRSQAQLIVKDSGRITSSIETSKSIVQLPDEKKLIEISCGDSQGEICEEDIPGRDSIVKVVKPVNSKQMILKADNSVSVEGALEKVPMTSSKDIRKDINKNANPITSTNNSKNPIIQALNNTSSSFARKLQAFELEYPEQREQRSTHKKVPSKLASDYFSCQTSPKNAYAKEVVVTTKPGHDFQDQTREGPVSASVSPISANKSSNQKSHKKPFEQTQTTLVTSFISGLDEYLEALTYNSNVSETVQENSRPFHNNMSMKRSNSSKFKEFSASRGQPFTLGQQEEQQEEQTVLMGNGPYSTNKSSKVKLNANPARLLTQVQQQKIIKELSQQRAKVAQMNSIIKMFHQELVKCEKKEKKLKQNQYRMIDVMKQLDQQLTQERHQRRKLEAVVADFESKIRGISRGRQKIARNSVQNEERPQRKTIYATSSIGNSIHFNHQKNKSKLQKHSKKPSCHRLSSMINSMSHNNCQQEQSYDTYFNGHNPVEECFFKNKTQKFSKIISNFELENQPCDQQEEMYFKSRNFVQDNTRKSNKDKQLMRDSLKNCYPQPSSCKNSYMNSSMPINTKNKSRPMTPKLVEELFGPSQKQKNHEYQTKNYSSSQQSYQETSQQYTGEQFDEDRDFESESEVRQTEISGDEFVDEEYCQEVMKRMR